MSSGAASSLWATSALALSATFAVARATGDWRIGPLTRHADLQVRDDLGVLAYTAGLIADQQVRNRGTIGGSIVHGDPASDMPTVLLALDGTVTVTGSGGATREVAAADVFEDYLTTTVAADEVLTEVRLPALEGWGHAYEKVTRRAEDWAMVGVCALVRRAADGSCEDVRVAFTTWASTRGRGRAPAAGGRGLALDAASIARAAEQAAEGTEPPADLNASAEYKRHLARVLTRRALERASN